MGRAILAQAGYPMDAIRSDAWRHARRWAGFAALACAALLLTGCAAARYEKVRLGETTPDALPRVFGKEPLTSGPWRFVSYKSTIPIELASVAVQTGENDRSRAKVLYSMTMGYWLLFVTLDFDLRVEMRVEGDEMDRLVQKYVDRARGAGLLAGELEDLGWAPRAELPEDGSEAPQPLATHEMADRLTAEQAPVAILEMLQAFSPPSFLWLLLTAKREQDEGTTPADEGDQAAKDDAFGIGLVSLPFSSLAAADEMDDLYAAAEAHHLYTAAAPLEIKAGDLCVRKHGAGWYELTRRYRITSPVWGAPSQNPTSAEGEPDEAPAAQPEEATTSAPSGA